MDKLSKKYLRARKIPSTACSGCGLGQAHKAFVQAIDELNFGIDAKDLALEVYKLILKKRAIPVVQAGVPGFAYNYYKYAN